MDLKTKGEKAVIVVEGNIGAGKTTLGEILAEELNTKLYRELSSDETLDVLAKFYSDKKKYAFLLQIHFLNERFRMIKDIFGNNGGILDRSIYGDKIFVDVLYEEKILSDFEFKTYEKLLNNMLEHSQKPTLLIYLDASVDTCIQRIKKRQRGGEINITSEYLKKLEEKYLSWYDNYNYSPKIKIPYNDIDVLDNANDKKAILEKILSKDSIKDSVYTS